MKSELDSIRTEKDSLSSRNTELQGLVDAQKEMIDNQLNSGAVNDVALKDAQADAALLKTRVSELESELSSKITENENLTVFLNKAKTLLQNLKSENTKLASDASTIANEKSELQIRFDEAISLLQEAKEDRTMFESRLKELDESR